MRGAPHTSHRKSRNVREQPKCVVSVSLPDLDLLTMREQVEATIRSEGVFRVAKVAVCFVADL